MNSRSIEQSSSGVSSLVCLLVFKLLLLFLPFLFFLQTLGISALRVFAQSTHSNKFGVLFSCIIFLKVFLLLFLFLFFFLGVHMGFFFMVFVLYVILFDYHIVFNCHFDIILEGLVNNLLLLLRL